MSGDDNGRDFWSRRKAAVRKADAEEEARKVAEAEAQELAGLEEKSDAEILEELGLPDPDTLTGEDDFTGYLAKTVPERLRRRALRKLWVTNPVLANLDGLNDYDEDFKAAEVGAQAVKTAYEVGRGFLKGLAEDATGEGRPETEQPGGVNHSEEPVFDAAQKESSSAMQNDLGQNGKEASQLTQRQTLVQSTGPKTIDSGETALIESEEERPTPRRRMKFDYE
ncbi:DUF3306 domain-containing protein [Roseibium sp.]|uniref:DUF3306 domain-containing protein n=1 Tax=Roseibium sp. TaxID=1936156 RepID=UPI003D0C5D8E